jgi:hypothetical protein
VLTKRDLSALCGTAILAVALGACGSAGRPLPTTDPVVNACPGIEIGGPLVLTSTPTGIVATTNSGQDLPVFWPPGFRAIFDPSFSSVVDDRGAVFATAGEDIHPYVTTGQWGGFNACVTGSQVFLFTVP